MRQTALVRPDYSQRFRCIGPACEDSCCQGWAVTIDQAAYEKYQNVQAGPLRTLLDDNMVRREEGATAANYATMRMTTPSQSCPILTEDKLCRIQVELGEELLCVTCATYPRVISSIDNIKETALNLSCPEAARLVLLDPDLTMLKPDGGYQMSWDDSKRELRTLLPFFWPIREIVFNLVRNRSFPVWQRLFLLGTLCRRLDGVARGEVDRGVVPVLEGFSAALSGNSLRDAMDTIKPDLPLQLDIVLKLAGICRERKAIGPRFLECIEELKLGIGARPDATMPDLIANYAAAYERHFAPFFAAHPYILENYLINTMFRRQFPFGIKDGNVTAEPEMAREFALLATQFALIKGLLIGVAGARGAAFAEEHVIHTVQSATKHFEHHPQFLDSMHELLVANGRDNPHGLTMLVRN